MIEILFQDADAVAVFKEAGYLSVPDRSSMNPATAGANKIAEGTLNRPVIGRMLEEQLGVRLFPVHRLDFDVSGILIFAKNAAAQRVYSRAFETRTATKLYSAWTEFDDKQRLQEKLEVRQKIHRGKKRSFVADHGKEAITFLWPREQIEVGGSCFQRWDLEPKTGRSHQLRLALLSLGLPIVGDQLYGSKRSLLPNGIALSSVRLAVASINITIDAPRLEYQNEGLKLIR